MKIARICAGCESPFLAQKDKQLYCSRKCFKKEYYRKLKIDTIVSFPVYKCPNCYNPVQMTFDPTKNEVLWKYFKCPKCTVDEDKIIEIFINPDDIFIAF